LFSYEDGYGNIVHCFTVLPPHTLLVVTARSRVETRLSNPFAPPRRSPPTLDPVDQWPLLQFGGPVLLLPDVEALAARFRPAQEAAVLDALRDLMHFIYTQFEYQAEVTTVSSTIEDLLRLGSGVCQDLTHLMIAVCRCMSVPARYVSGYIVSEPAHAARGDGASHAWCEAWVPGYGWRGFDPTNDVLAADSHIKVGHGRSYQDVPPTRGVYRGTAGQQIMVEVITQVVESEGSI
jgi:transglutaminase-like putative cysteine protease